MEFISGGLSNIKGIRFGSTKEGKHGLVLIASDSICNSVGVFTTNKSAAVPVILTRDRLKGGIQAIVANSGNANACTGEQGYENALKTSSAVAAELGIESKNVAIASTGIIGKQLDIDLITSQIKRVAGRLDNNKKASMDAAKAIMTTDTVPKEICYRFKLEDGTIAHIAGIEKGSGMISPNMATMLCFLYTDAPIERKFMQKCLNESVENSFNMISVDNDMSTNDSVLLLSTNKGELRSQNFREALNLVCKELAKKIVMDGEGATKFIEIKVMNARREEEARRIAKMIAASMLVKTAMFGNNPNWGRIASAVGSAGVEFDLDKLKIGFEIKGKKIPLFNGEPLEFDFKALAEKLKGVKEIKILVDLSMGKEDAVAWSSDLSYDYVKINAEYT